MDKRLTFPWLLPVILAVMTADATTDAFLSHLPSHKGDPSMSMVNVAGVALISESRPGSNDGNFCVSYGMEQNGRLIPLPVPHSPTLSRPSDASRVSITHYDSRANRYSSIMWVIRKQSEVRSIVRNAKRRLKTLLHTVFLPVGFPSSVAPEYLRYQQWNVVQDLSTYLRGILATQAILEGVGVGREGATPLAATLQWITRDGASMMSGLVFTSFLSTNFGVNAKSWRLFADFMVDIGITLDMLAPLFPKNFLLCICLASVCKSLCGIAAGASNGNIVEHMARTNNLAEVLAKGGAQHTAVSLFGLGFGMWFARVANQSPRRVWTAYTLLTVIHLTANYAAMRVLAFTSINRRRLDVLLTAFRQNASVLSPAEVARRETIIVDVGRWRPPKLWTALFQKGKRRATAELAKDAHAPFWNIRLGVRVKDLTRFAEGLRELQRLFSQEQYMLNIVNVFDGEMPTKKVTRKIQIAVALREDATNLTLLKACLHADLIAQRGFEAVKSKKGTEDMEIISSVISSTYQELCQCFPNMVQGLQRQGWNLERVLLSPEGWIYHKIIE